MQYFVKCIFFILKYTKYDIIVYYIYLIRRIIHYFYKKQNYTFVFLFYILYYLHQGTDDHFYTQQIVLNVLRSLYV